MQSGFMWQCDGLNKEGTSSKYIIEKIYDWYDIQAMRHFDTSDFVPLIKDQYESQGSCDNVTG